MVTAIPVDAILSFAFVAVIGMTALVLSLRFANRHRQSPAGKILLVGLAVLLMAFAFTVIREIRKTKEEHILQGIKTNKPRFIAFIAGVVRFQSRSQNLADSPL